MSIAWVALIRRAHGMQGCVGAYMLSAHKTVMRLYWFAGLRVFAKLHVDVARWPHVLAGECDHFACIVAEYPSCGGRPAPLII